MLILTRYSVVSTPILWIVMVSPWNDAPVTSVGIFPGKYRTHLVFLPLRIPQLLCFHHYLLEDRRYPELSVYFEHTQKNLAGMLYIKSNFFS